MTMKKIATIALSAFIVNALAFSVAEAAQVRVKCEKRASPARSSISVDVRDLVPGQYSATVTSGGNASSSPLLSSIGDEWGHDWDSNPKDIALGAQSIETGFIQNGQVSANVLDAEGFVVGSAANVACRTR